MEASSTSTSHDSFSNTISDELLPPQFHSISTSYVAQNNTPPTTNSKPTSSIFEFTIPAVIFSALVVALISAINAKQKSEIDRINAISEKETQIYKLEKELEEQKKQVDKLKNDLKLAIEDSSLPYSEVIKVTDGYETIKTISKSVLEALKRENKRLSENQEVLKDQLSQNIEIIEEKLEKIESFRAYLISRVSNCQSSVKWLNTNSQDLCEKAANYSIRKNLKSSRSKKKHEKIRLNEDLSDYLGLITESLKNGRIDVINKAIFSSYIPISDPPSLHIDALEFIKNTIMEHHLSEDIENELLVETMKVINHLITLLKDA